MELNYSPRKFCDVSAPYFFLWLFRHSISGLLWLFTVRNISRHIQWQNTCLVALWGLVCSAPPRQKTFAVLTWWAHFSGCFNDIVPQSQSNTCDLFLVLFLLKYPSVSYVQYMLCMSSGMKTNVGLEELHNWINWNAFLFVFWSLHKPSKYKLAFLICQ